MRRILYVFIVLCCSVLMVSCTKQEPVEEAVTKATEEPVTLKVKSSLESEPVSMDEALESDRPYSVDTSVPSCIDIQGKSVTLNNISVDQVSTGTRCQENLSLIRVFNKGMLTLSGSSISASADSTAGLDVSDATVEVKDSAFIVTGQYSSCILSADNGTVSITNSTLLSEADSSFCLTAQKAGAVSCSGCDLSGKSILRLLDAGKISLTGGKAAGSVRYLGFDNELILDNTTLEGTLEPESDSCDLVLRLTNSSTFTGSTIENTGTGVSVYLDSSSTWNLTSDAYVDGFSVENNNLDKILSNGHHIYYNSEHEDCTWLESKSYNLPHGGTLSPLI